MKVLFIRENDTRLFDDAFVHYEKWQNPSQLILSEF